VIPVPENLKKELKAKKKYWLAELVECAAKKKTANVVIPPVSIEGTSLVLQLSDLHIGQQNKFFNLEIAKQRIAELPMRLYEATRPILINEVIIMFIGDIVEGEDIYPTQAHHILCPVIEQVEIGTAILWDLILATQDLFKVPVRVICVSGNHGRASPTVSEKTNWDNVLYHCLKILISERKDKNIGIECDYSEFKTFRVKDKIGLMNHQGVKHAGTPAMREKIAGWVFNKKCDFIASGHWHEWKVGSWQSATFIANGSLCGPNDLSERMAQETPARQGYFLVTTGRPLWGFGFIEWQNESNLEDVIPPDPPEFQCEDGSNTRNH